MSPGLRRALVACILIISTAWLSSSLRHSTSWHDYHSFKSYFDLAPAALRLYTSNKTLDHGNHNLEESCVNHPSSLDNVLVILKTGASESREKLPVHFHTTLTCVQDFVIYSDLNETIEGHDVVDVLDIVDETIKGSHSDFDFYRRLHDQGRGGLQETDSGDHSPAWNLDKWKFLPIVEKALQHSPDAQWFIWVEADTYVSWHNLAAYLKHLDPTKIFYAGAQMQIGPQIFAHGGSGALMSRTSMQLASESRRDRLKEYNDFTSDHWAGDCVLGKLLEETGSSLLWAWPVFQGKPPSALDHAQEAYGKRLWCTPALTYHHITSNEIRDLWTFEQQWFSTHPPNSTLLHSDVFKHVIFPQISAMGYEADEWDNLSDQETFEGESLHEDIEPETADVVQKYKAGFRRCKALCSADYACVQYRYLEETCYTSNTITLGHRSLSTPANVSSGWIEERIHSFIRDATSWCPPEAQWVLP